METFNTYGLVIGNGNYTLINANTNFNGTLLSKYNLGDYGYITSIKNQLAGGNCWSFAAIAAFESCILKATNKTYDLS